MWATLASELKQILEQLWNPYAPPRVKKVMMMMTTTTMMMTDDDDVSWVDMRARV